MLAPVACGVRTFLHFLPTVRAVVTNRGAVFIPWKFLLLAHRMLLHRPTGGSNFACALPGGPASSQRCCGLPGEGVARLLATCPTSAEPLWIRLDHRPRPRFHVGRWPPERVGTCLPFADRWPSRSSLQEINQHISFVRLLAHPGRPLRTFFSWFRIFSEYEPLPLSTCML